MFGSCLGLLLFRHASIDTQHGTVNNNPSLADGRTGTVDSETVATLLMVSMSYENFLLVEEVAM